MIVMLAVVCNNELLIWSISVYLTLDPAFPSQFMPILLNSHAWQW